MLLPSNRYEELEEMVERVRTAIILSPIFPPELIYVTAKISV